MKPSSVPLGKESSPFLLCFSKALSTSLKALISYLSLPLIIYFFHFSPYPLSKSEQGFYLTHFCIPSTATPRPLNVVIHQAPAPTHLVSSTKKVCSLPGLCQDYVLLKHYSHAISEICLHSCSFYQTVNFMGTQLCPPSVFPPGLGHRVYS